MNNYSSIVRPNYHKYVAECSEIRGTPIHNAPYRATIWFPKPRDRVFDYRSIEAFCKKFMEDNGGELLGFDCQHLQFAFTMLKYENVIVAWQTK